MGFFGAIGDAVGGLFGGGGGGGTNTVVQSTALPDYLEDPVKENINIAGNIANRAYQAYTSPTVATLSEPQLEAIRRSQLGLEIGQPQLFSAEQATQQAISGFGNVGIGGPANISAMTLTPQQIAAQNAAAAGFSGVNVAAPTSVTGQGYTGVSAAAPTNVLGQGYSGVSAAAPASVIGQGYTGIDVTAPQNVLGAMYNAAQMQGPANVQAQNFLTGNLQGYMNPFTQNVIDAAMRDLASANELGLQQVGQQARQAGAFGGSRQGVAEALQRSQAIESAGRLSANLRSQAYQDAASRMAADQARAMQADLANQQMGFNVGQANQAAQMRALSEGAGFQQQANLANQAAQQQAALANQAARMQGLSESAGFRQQANLANQQAQQQTALANQAATMQGLSESAGFRQQANLANQQARQQTALANQAAAMQGLSESAGFRQQANLANQQAQQQAALANQSAAMQGLSQSAGFRQQANLANQDAAMRAALANQQAGLTAGQLNQASALQAALANQQMGFDVAAANQQARLAGLQGQLAGAQQLAGLGQLGRDFNQQNIAQLLSSGAVEQAQNQAILDDAYARFLERRNYPIDMLNLRIGATSSVPVAGTTTQTGGGSGGSSFLSTIGGLGSAAAGLAQLGGLLGLSDENMKTDIKKVGKDKETGLNLYAYRYKGDPKTYPKIVGPMAQEVEKKFPDQVVDIGKFKAVNLGFGPMQRAFS